jgi:putative lipoic acid-binding regulatory protein
MSKIDLTTLREKLKESGAWPRVYFFKFIIPSDNQKLAQVEALFGPEAQVQLKQSSKGNYVSVSAKELMLDVDGVIKRYEEASKIEGLMAL